MAVLDDESCESCESQLILVDLPKRANEGEKKGCIFCTEDFEPFIEKHRVIENKGFRGRGRGGRGGRRGRGRGRGGRRGRGRGRP